MITFQIKGGHIGSQNVDKNWIWKWFVATVKFKKYVRRYHVALEANVDSNRKIKLGDIFITGLAKPHPAWRVMDKVNQNKIYAISVHPLTDRNPVVMGSCAIVQRFKDEGSNNN